ncbi:hypothetical protein, partial [uncultured Bacteroides sp.]|uniref:hypothetical protein n=1 Tax=uncultured Bacteroides sp. TaxID=162156 RepID=UPI00261853A7
LITRYIYWHFLYKLISSKKKRESVSCEKRYYLKDLCFLNKPCKNIGKKDGFQQANNFLLYLCA